MIFRKKKEELDTGAEQRDLLVAYKQTFGSPQGKLVLYDLLNRYHVLKSHDGSAFMEGQRSVAVSIITKCSISIAQFDEMLKGENE